MVEHGDLRVTIDQVLPLAAIATAHQLEESGRVRGKVTLIP
ncbi:zinc-binding dehydrogenase [Nocardia sp. NPDC049220]